MGAFLLCWFPFFLWWIIIIIIFNSLSSYNQHLHHHHHHHYHNTIISIIIIIFIYNSVIIESTSYPIQGTWYLQYVDPHVLQVPTLLLTFSSGSVNIHFKQSLETMWPWWMFKVCAAGKYSQTSFQNRHHAIKANWKILITQHHVHFIWLSWMSSGFDQSKLRCIQ